MSSITLAIPPAVVQEARAYAKRTDTSLNAMIRDYLESLVSRRDGASGEDPAESFARLVSEKGAVLRKPYRFRRADAYDGEELA